MAGTHVSQTKGRDGCTESSNLNCKGARRSRPTIHGTDTQQISVNVPSQRNSRPDLPLQTPGTCSRVSPAPRAPPGPCLPTLCPSPGLQIRQPRCPRCWRTHPGSVRARSLPLSSGCAHRPGRWAVMWSKGRVQTASSWPQLSTPTPEQRCRQAHTADGGQTRLRDSGASAAAKALSPASLPSPTPQPPAPALQTTPHPQAQGQWAVPCSCAHPLPRTGARALDSRQAQRGTRSPLTPRPL